MSTPTSPQTYTAEAYLTLEVESDIRHEYRNGAIIPMTGRTPAHNEICRMFVFLLTATLRQQTYNIFVTDQRLWIPEMNYGNPPSGRTAARSQRHRDKSDFGGRGALRLD